MTERTKAVAMLLAILASGAASTNVLAVYAAQVLPNMSGTPRYQAILPDEDRSI
jgi:hypothetical protein